MQRILLALITTYLSAPVLADEVSVTEFVPGTIISSADMNQNFDILVQESNENDDRITVLENAEPVSGGSSGPGFPTWVDGEGNVIGYALGGGEAYNAYDYVTVKLPETDLVMSPSYWFSSGSGINYLGDNVLRL